VRREEARNNFQIKGRRYIFLKNVDHLTQALSRLEAQNLDTIQAMQIRMNLQQLFTMDAKTARRFLDRWNAWVQVCDLGPMKRLAKTIMAKAEGILRSIAPGLSNGVLEAINGNVQAAKRKAKGYRTMPSIAAATPGRNPRLRRSRRDPPGRAHRGSPASSVSRIRAYWHSTKALIAFA